MKRQFNLVILFSILSGFSSGLNANMLLNSGFEEGLTNWQSSGNAHIRNADPLAYEGKNYIYGKNTPLYSVWQDVDLVNTGLLPSAIDAGSYVVKFGGWQSGWNNQRDSGQISVHLYDDSMSELGNASLLSFFSNYTWVEQSGTTDLIAGTRFIRYKFIGDRVAGSNNDGYLDAAYLDVTAVPLPASIWLFGSALLLLFGSRKKAA